MSRIGLIWAQTPAGVIGAQGGMPWHVPEDLAHFKETTLGSPVVMGRRTWESFPDRFRPLPGRRNIVVTSHDDVGEGAETVRSLGAALDLAGQDDPEWVWVIGGGQIFAAAIDGADRLEVTELDIEVQGDTVAPEVIGWHVTAHRPAEGWLTSRTGIRYRFLRLER
ncbi:dihydrofolate reductase [Microbacterium mangrovi]|uniref:Dihydrofolate reductase n=1 Tax=Microbacterium mangrovi TaxID=1348253 RepID=A0A0B2A313_9MICO|nr:dihydrofolate reductase [Microbacterium mangrovi]KHK96174.1 dihydrofolate reductase [Microbacterium mangrovi]